MPEPPTRQPLSSSPPASAASFSSEPCGADTATCTFDVTHAAGSHDLHGRVTDEFGGSELSARLTVEVEASGGTGGGGEAARPSAKARRMQAREAEA